MKKNTTLGLIIGTRDFFPAEPVRQAREELMRRLDELNVDIITLNEETTRFGAVESWEDSKKCAALFAQNRIKIDGILVMLPVFGPERGIADAIRLSELNVPVLVQAYPDYPDKLNVELRRDSLCGKFSVTNNLYQYRIPFSLTQDHCISPTSEKFIQELIKFIGVCRVVRGLKNVRIGAIGARPTIFNTVRFSEKILEANGISVNTVDLSEILGEARKMGNSDAAVVAKLEAVHKYIDARKQTSEAMFRMAKLGVAIDNWTIETEVTAVSFQCWTSLQKNYGVNACTLMSMMSENLLPTGCEVDMTGVLGMYILQLASGHPSALVDWNNNYGDESNKCILFHCGNWAKSFFDKVDMSYGEILATVLGKENTVGTMSGQAKASPATLLRISTDDVQGKIRSYIAEGRLTDDPLDTFGSRAVLEIPSLQKLFYYIAKNGFEHHASMNPSFVGDIIMEAFETYLGWSIYRHN
jgi:L-fucose isomerase-like protein